MTSAQLYSKLGKSPRSKDFTFHTKSGDSGAAGGVSKPMSGPEIQRTAIPNTYSLAWRLGRCVSIAQQTSSLSTVTEALIRECGGPQSARVIFQGKIRSVESMLTTTAHSVGKVVIERLGEGESENESERGLGGGFKEVSVPFMNENLAVVGVDAEGTEKVSSCYFKFQ